MPNRSRLALVLFLIGLFCLGTPAVVLFSQGYRLDSKQWKIVHTGAFHLKSRPAGVSLTLNDKPKRIRASRFLYSGVIIKNLVPGVYKVKVSASSSLSWQKNIEIKPSLVSKATRLVLPLARPKTQTLFRTATGSQPLNVLKETAFFKSFDQKTVFSVDLNQPDSLKQIFPPPETADPLKSKENIKDFLPSASLDNFIIQTGQATYALTDKTIVSMAKIMETIAGDNHPQTIQLAWHPFDDNILFAFGSGASYWINIPDLSAKQIAKEKTIGWNKNGAKAYFLFSSGVLAEFSTQLEPTSTALTSLDPTLFSRFPLEIHDLGKDRLIIHEPSGLLILIDIGSRHSELIDTAVRLVKISPDASRLVYLTNDRRLFAYFLEPVLDDSAYGQYEKILLAEITDAIQPQDLHLANDNWYAVLNTEWGAFIVEIDKRQPINQWVVSLEKKIRPLIFEASNASLIWHQDNAFYASQILP
jgi:hypothetical protein